jgi:integral membrane protein
VFTANINFYSLFTNNFYSSMSFLNIFRKIAILEGISYLLLLFVAMPLKYAFDMPLAVKYTGWVHGLLFVLYAVCLVLAWQETKWKFGKAVLIFLASLLPFAPFIVDKKLKSEN